MHTRGLIDKSTSIKKNDKFTQKIGQSIAPSKINIFEGETIFLTNF